MLGGDWLRCALIVALALAGGCGRPIGTVSGVVTMDEQPLEKGIISFSAAEGAATESASPPVSADITGGRYSAEMVAGKKFVQISASKVIGTRKQSDAPGAAVDEIFEEQLPPKYNSSTELTLEVKPGGNSKDWAVESIRGKRR